jgi:chaperone LolA
MKILGPIFSILMSSSAFAGPAENAVDDVLNHLRLAEGFYSHVVKTVHSGQLDSTNESKGEIYFAKGKMRLELTTPEKTLLVYDGKMAWQESEFDDGTDKRAIVTKIKAKQLKKGSALLATILGDKDLLTAYKMTVHEIDHYEFVPKDKKNADISLFKIDVEDRKLKKVAYIDSLENEVSFVFEDIQEKQIPAKKFQYKPPKGADVSEM